MIMLLAIRHRIEFLVFQAIVCAIDSMSPRTSANMARQLAWFVHRVLPRKWTRFHVAKDNIKKAFGEAYSDVEIDSLIHGMWIHLFRTVVEIVQAPRKLHLHSYRSIVKFADFTRMNEAVCSGRRVLMLGGHFGNWEIGTNLMGLWGFPMGVVAREMDNPYLHKWFQQSREQSGHRLLLKRGDFDDLTTLLTKGGNLGLLCDQDAGSRGLFVDFFGTPASTFKSIALLALEYDALIVVGYSIRVPDDASAGSWSQFEVGCEALIDPRQTQSGDPVREISQEFTSALERAIRRAPDQYFWLHRRWKSEPKIRRKAEPQKLAG
jgi:KDO2-lipid IV(A) lauroyltransferase